jgi:integrase
MGHVQDRWFTTSKHPDTGKLEKRKTAVFGKGMRYKVRYLDPDGQEHSKAFPDKCKRLADDFLIEIESKKRDGSYVDSRAGHVKFKPQAENWLKGQSPDRSTRMQLTSRLNSQLYPYFGDYRIKDIKTSNVRDWLGTLDDRSYSQNYRAVLFTMLSSILDSAVDDHLITTNPCKAKTIKRPVSPRSNVVVWPVDRFLTVQSAFVDHFRIVPTLGAGCGLRQGELLGFSPDDVDQTRRAINVLRQIRIVDRQLVFALPKGGKTRRVPLPTSVLAAIEHHERMHPPVMVTLPWMDPSGEPTTVRLLATGAEGRLYSGDLFNKSIWRCAFREAGLTYQRRADGMHALRHFYASTLLAQGVSIKELAEYLGHSDPGFTLRTYTHLVPSSFERARAAIDNVLDTPTSMTA